MTSDQPAAAPRDRIATLDIIRGVAVMGILAMNIVAFAMPQSAYMNPASYGGATGINLATWAFDFVLIDGKMRGLFSFLFGASTLLVIDQARAKGENPARVHFARMFWLFLFGMAHLYFIWWGDILHHYALVGAIAYLFRDAPPPKLLAAALILILMEVIMTANPPFTAHALEIAMRAPQPSAATIRAYQALQDTFGIMSPDRLARDLATHRGSYAMVFNDRLAEANQAPVNTLVFFGLETLAYMLLGMAALRSGMLTGEWPRERYRRWIAIGFGIGIPAQIALAAIMVLNGFSLFVVTLCGGDAADARATGDDRRLGQPDRFDGAARKRDRRTDRCSGPHGLFQLSGHQPDLHDAVLRLWFRPVRPPVARGTCIWSWSASGH